MKTVIIGLDGADWKYIKQDLNELPTFKKLIENGTHGNLTSTMPPITCPAWPCFFTGQNPGKIGIFKFTFFNPEKNEVELVNSKMIKNKKMWQYLNENKIKTIIAGVPGTYPPEQLDGIMITGIMTPSKEVDYTYPAELREEIKDVFEIGGRNTNIHNREKHWEDQLEKLEKRKKLLKKMLTEKEWDFFIGIFQSTDVIQHMFLNPPVDEKKVVEFYKIVDNVLAEILELLDKDTTIMLMSDHGGEPWNPEKPVKIFHIYEWLRKEGYLQEKKKRKKSLFNVTKIYFSLRSRGLDLKKFVSQKTVIRTLNPFFSIDWENTSAFSDFYVQRWGGVSINLKGRNKFGLVEKQEYEKMRDEIISKLKMLKDPDTGENVVEKIWKKEEIYTGDLKGSPDIIIQANNSYSIKNIRSNSIFTVKKEVFGIHAQDGIFLAKGPNIMAGKEIQGAKLIDITPTVLAMYGIEVPADMDGKVLPIFEKPVAIKKQMAESAEKAKIKEKLKKLKI